MGGGAINMHYEEPARAPAANRPKGRGHFDDDDDEPNFGNMISLDSHADKKGPKGGGGGRLVDQIKPPTFDDDLDEEEMAREEEELLARVRAKQGGGGAPAKPTPMSAAPPPTKAQPAPAAEVGLPTIGGARGGGGGSSSNDSPLGGVGAPNKPLSKPSFLDDFDDLEAEEIF